MAASIDSDDDNFSCTSVTIIDKDNEHINPRCYEEELPEDLWVQIFIRLPVKSLLLGTYVCKHWYVLIKDPIFVRKHLQFQKMMSKNSGYFLLQHYHETAKVYNLFLFDREFVNSATSSTLSPLPYHNLLHCSLELEYDQIEIDGPINGLYCLHNEEGCIVIWNPATSEVVFLPFPNDCIPDGMRDEKRWLERGVIGFGTDPLDEEDYKVILISFCDCDFDDLGLYGFVYTTKTNTWRLIEDDLVRTPSVIRSLNSTYLNGFYYWIGSWDGSVVAFDMSKEFFRRISTPCDGDNLVLHNDHINMFSLNKNLNEVDIWVMLEESNWVKKISVRGIQGSVVRSWLGFWKTENEILLVIDDSEEMSGKNSRTVLYNTTTRETRNIGPRGRTHCFKASVYYESLVSLNGGIKGNDCAASLLKFLLDNSDEETTSND